MKYVILCLFAFGCSTIPKPNCTITEEFEPGQFQTFASENLYNSSESKCVSEAILFVAEPTPYAVKSLEVHWERIK